MQFKVVQASGPRILVAVFAKGDEAVEGLTGLARRERLGASQLTAVGAFEAAMLGYFDRERRGYRGSRLGSRSRCSAWLATSPWPTASRRSTPTWCWAGPMGARWVATCSRGGRVWPTLEVIVTELPAALRKRHDEQTGLALIDLDAAPPA
jgi:predicted DNA-binding protein with PD1-like motif